MKIPHCTQYSIVSQVKTKAKTDQINICHEQVFGEIAHFLIATTSKDVAGDIHYGDQVKLWNMICLQKWKCELLTQACLERGNSSGSSACKGLSEDRCVEPSIAADCEWTYNGQGYQFQVLIITIADLGRLGPRMMSTNQLSHFGRFLLAQLLWQLFRRPCCLWGSPQTTSTGRWSSPSAPLSSPFPAC